MAAVTINQSSHTTEATRPFRTWPVALMISAYPIWFVLGLSGFMWVIMAIPMAAAMLSRRDLIAPKGIGLWVLFLVAVVGSAFSLDGVPRLAGYTLRLGYYLAASTLLLYIINGRKGLPPGMLVRSYTQLWMATVAGGYFALVLGDFHFHSPMWYLLPGPLLENDLISALATPGFADLQNIVGYPVPRPKAPFPYTNSWGAMLALLTPFAFASLYDRSTGISPRLIKVVLAASIIPAVMSLNRGLWLSFSVGVVYVVFRLAVGGKTSMFFRLIGLFLVLAAVLLLTPLGELIVTRFQTGHSNDTRSGLAWSAIVGASERPIFGWGAPRPNVGNLPSVGTHGQLWMVAFSHGFFGLAAFLGTLVVFFRSTARQLSMPGLWIHTVVLIGLSQTPVYLMVPGQLFVVLGAVGIALRYQMVDAEPGIQS